MTEELFSKQEIRDRIQGILENEQFGPEKKILELTRLRLRGGCDSKEHGEQVDNAIEEVFAQLLRRLNGIREANQEWVALEDLEELKAGFAQLFSLIDDTLDWNPGMKTSLRGVINRASLRCMLIDPEVSVKTKQEILDNWDDFM